MDQTYVVHNAKEVAGSNIWLVIDRSSGTAISQRDTEEEARKDADVANAFYDRWPTVEPIKNVAASPGGVNEDGTITSQYRPLLSPGFWSEHDFG
jgi:hypothetical protein